MKCYRLTLRPLTPFGTPLAGDTLFGQLCWAVIERFGRTRLDSLLEGYTQGQPFLALSDAFPAGLLPRPTVPDAALHREAKPEQRKVARKLVWLPASDAALPLAAWLDKAEQAEVAETSILTQNTINRLTGTTGQLQFAPRQVERTAYRSGARLDLHAVVDEDRLAAEELRKLVEDIGAIGYGRDASTGLGKFSVEGVAEHHWSLGPSKHWLTLAPCAPDPASLDAERCYYLPVTRFGRHGNVGVRLGAPFKRPLLLAKTGALLTSRAPAGWLVHGRGLGGRSAPLSAVIPETVHQGYAPVVPLNAELEP
jgi:CRISPR-associated protein Csm4